jgi:hypothetical protein
MSVRGFANCTRKIRILAKNRVSSRLIPLALPEMGSWISLIQDWVSRRTSAVENGSLSTRSTKQSCVFLNLQIIASHPQISPQNGRLLLLKDTGEESPRTEICC